MSSATWYVRNPAVVTVASRDSYLFFLAQRPPVRLSSVDTNALSAVLSKTATPVSGESLLVMCAEELLALLVKEEILLSGTADEVTSRATPKFPVATKKLCRRVVVGVCGTIVSIGAIEHVVAIADTLADEVDVVITRSARKFVQPCVYEYFGFRTWTNAFVPKHGVQVPHIHLATTADLVLIAPASANVLRRLATGACSDLLSLVVSATEAPVVVAPAMNARMWKNPAIARNVAQLRADGIWVVEPRVGFEVSKRLQSGDVGGLGFRGGEVIRVLASILEQATVARGSNAVHDDAT